MIHVLVLRDAEDCRSCDEVVQQFLDLKREFSGMHVRQRSMDEEPELVARLGVVAAPAVIVNDQLAFQGHPDAQFVQAYLTNVQQGLHDDPESYPPQDERLPGVNGQEATGSMDTVWRGSGRQPSHGSQHGGRH